jgi:MFS family permease
MTVKSHKLQRAACVAVALLNYLDRQLIVTMGPPIKAELLVGDAQFGMLSATFLLVYAFCSPVAGFIADRFGRRSAPYPRRGEALRG